MYLDVLQRVGEVWQVHPEYLLALGIVKWHSVEGDVDAGCVGPSYPEVGVAYTQSILRKRYQRWGILQNSRDISCRILLFDIRCSDVGVGDRCVGSCSCTGNNQFFELNVIETVGGCYFDIRFLRRCSAGIGC